jgi:uncharacterized RDD family membrane protein YckC
VTELPAGIEYVGFWSRVIASLIDTVLSAVIIWPVVTAIYGSDVGLDAALPAGSPGDLLALLGSSLAFRGPLDFLVSWVLPAVAVIVFWVARQATPGKMVIHARIVDAVTLGKPTSGQMIGRYLGYYVSMLPFALGFFWVGWDKRKQGWHDKLAGTVVIRDRPKTVNK